METSGNTVLVTGGATGIGFALAQAFVSSDNRVLICGRRAARLEEAQRKLPQIQVMQCDLTEQTGRESLVNWVKERYPEINVLVNNAGIQRAIDLRQGLAELLRGDDEIRVNLVAPVYLSACFAPILMQRKEAAIINVSSGLAFVPIAAMPVYCATKAAVHSFSVSLRHQLRGTAVKVFEIIPPAVDTELGMGSTQPAGQTHGGIPPSDVATETMRALQDDEYEIAVGRAKSLAEGPRQDFEKRFQQMNRW